MGWQTDYFNIISPSGPYWINNGTGMTRDNQGSTNSLRTLKWVYSGEHTYNANKNWLFITTLNAFSSISDYSPGNYLNSDKYLKITTPWNISFEYKKNSSGGDWRKDTRPFSIGDVDLQFFSSPSNNHSYSNVSTNLVEYDASYYGFGDPSSSISSTASTIKRFQVIEMDWFVQGWSLQSNGDFENKCPGWKYDVVWDNFEFRPQHQITNTSFDRLPYGYNPDGTISNGFTSSNYIARYIPYPSFNITFTVETGSNNDSFVDMYLISTLDDNLKTNNITTFESTLNNGQYLGRLGDNGSNTYTFYNLTGDQYLLFRGNNDSVNNTPSVKLKDFSIDGAYQENDNNTQFLFTNSSTYSEPTPLCLIGGSYDATYSVNVANENTLHQVGTSSNFSGPTGFPGYFSNLYGNVINLNSLSAKVGNGTFKSGVWENGVWNSGWRVDDNIKEFDDIEISLLMKTSNTKWRIQISGPAESLSEFKIGDRVSIGNIVGIDINENRKLMTNYFTVLLISNNSIVVDFNNTFPLRRIEKDSDNHKIKITKNVWLNGGFLNGYFEGIWNNGLFKGFPYITEMYNTHWIDGRYDGGHFYGEYPDADFVDTYWWQDTTPNTLGFTFSTPHGFLVGDKVSVYMDDQNLNPQYNGDSTIIYVNDYMVVVDKTFGASSTSEGGKLSRRTGTAVIQNFEFFDNNVAVKTISDTSNLQAVYKYNSWVDVKWLDESATNLGRSQVLYSPEYGEYSQNNLYGHITEDVLDSKSSFRNSHNMDKTIYSLGTKYTIYEDFLGDISEFNEPFNLLPILPDTEGKMDNFYNNGWTYSFIEGTPTNLNIERDFDESLKIVMGNGVSSFGLENTNINIEKKRYSKVEFDLLEYTSPTDYNSLGDLPSIYLLNTLVIPIVSTPAFPDQEFVFHRYTEKIKKYEYFYNRTELNLILFNSGGGYVDTNIDNIKFYEIDKAPFFKYITDDYINKAVQVPYQGVAPFIDYEDNQFSFIDNINIGLDSLSTEQSFNDPNDDTTGTTGPIGTILNILP